MLGAGLAAGIVLALAWRPWRRSAGADETRVATAAAFAAAYAWVYVALHGGGPPWPPKEAGHWLVLLVVASPLLALRGALAWVLRAVAVASFLWLGLAPLRQHVWSGGGAALWLGGLFVAWIVLLASRADLARRVRGADAALTAAVTCAGTAKALGESWMGSAGHLAGGLTAACVAWLGLALWRRELPIAPAAWVPLGLALPGLLVIAAFFTEIPPAVCVLLALAPEVGRLEVGPRGGWRATLVHAAAAAALVALAVGLALPAESPYGHASGR